MQSMKNIVPVRFLQTILKDIRLVLHELQIFQAGGPANEVLTPFIFHNVELFSFWIGMAGEQERQPVIEKWGNAKGMGAGVP